MNIVYLVFGKQLNIHQQAHFSILTLLANGGDCFDNIIVITDEPEYYPSVLSSKLVVEPIDAKTLTQWKGELNYPLRVKIKALQFIVDNYKYKDTPLLFLDTDTFIIDNLQN